MVRSLKGKSPRIATSAFVSEAAYVVGDVEIGEGASVWPGAVIRGDFGTIRIGCATCVEDNSVVHSAGDLTIGDGVIIGHGVVVHGLTVGDRCLIGSHATILDGAEIGAECIVSAGTLVPPRMRIPERSFVAGSPAEIRGKVHDRHLERLTAGLFLYESLVRDYREQGL